MSAGTTALVRTRRGGLQLQRFAGPAEAVDAAQGRELAQPAAYRYTSAAQIYGRGRGRMLSSRFARALGLSPRTVRRAFDAGELPGAIEHSARRLWIPTGLLRLAESFGFKQVRAWARAGLIDKEGPVCR